MSGLQVYKFRAVDRTLTQKERKEVSSWSSRSHATATSATFSYSYGDFPKNEERVLRDYFDIFLYFDSYGIRRLMLKFPKELVDVDTLKQFNIEAHHSYETYLKVTSTFGYLLVDFYWADEEGGFWAEVDDFEISDFLTIREAILNGDYSALYLYWSKLAISKANWDEEEEEDYNEDHVDYDPSDYEDKDYLSPKTNTPPIPPKLQYITTTLQSFSNLFLIDKDLVAAAKIASSKQPKAITKKNYKVLLQQLSEEEKDNYLLQLLNGELRVDMKLKKHLDSIVPSTNSSTTVSLIDLKKQKIKERQNREKAEQLAAEQKHLKKMQKMASEKTKHWDSVYYNLGKKQGKAYDLATETLKDLKDLSIHESKEAAFNSKMEQIKQDYGRSRVLLERFRKAGL